MTESKRSPKAEATADLFRILKAMACDPDVRDADFRLAFRIAQAVNAQTDWAIIGDDCLIDDVPRCDRTKLRRFRRYMEGLLWIETIEGRRGRATEYRFRDDRVQRITERRNADADRREDAFHLREMEKRARRQARGLGGDFTPLSNDGLGGETPPDTEAILPPLLPQNSTSEISIGTVQDMASAAPDPEIGEIPPPSTREGCQRCEECGRPGVVNVGGEWRCDRHRFSPPLDPELDAYLLASRGE